MGTCHSKSNQLVKRSVIYTDTGAGLNLVSAKLALEFKMVKQQLLYENLVFSGGGIKGLTHCGAVKYLDEIGVLPKIKKIAGTSAGAIIATLLAVGYTGQELLDFAHSLNFESLLDASYIIVTDIYRLVKDYGVCEGGGILHLMEELITAKVGNKNYTFADLYRDRGIELVLTGTNVTAERADYFCHQNTPTLPLAHAVRISMSIPILFQAVDLGGQLYVDGGVLDDCPAHVFDTTIPGDTSAILRLVPPNVHTLVLDIKVAGTPLSKNKPISNLMEFSFSLINTLMRENEKKTQIFYSERTVILTTPNYPLSRFYLTTEEKNQLIDMGYHCCKSWMSD